MRIPKPFRMISLRKLRQQPPCIDILTKNTGGWGYIPTRRAWSESSRPSFTDSTSTGAGSTWSPCNNCQATPSAFLHKQLDVTEAGPGACASAQRVLAMLLAVEDAPFDFFETGGAWCTFSQ